MRERVEVGGGEKGERGREREKPWLFDFSRFYAFLLSRFLFYWQLNTRGLVLGASFSSSAPHNVISAHSISDVDDCAGD